MPLNLGTRTQQNFRKAHFDQGQESRNHYRDVGMSKLTTDTMTFSTAGTITGSGTDFANFAAGDPILVLGTNLNNGFYTITVLNSNSQITVDPAPKNETISCTIRTP